MGVDTQARAHLANYFAQKQSAAQADNRMQQISRGFTAAQILLSRINDSINSQTPEKLLPMLKTLVELNTSLLETMKAFTVVFPETYPVTGEVKVNEMPAVEVKNLPDLKTYFDSVSKEITGMQLKVKNLSELKPYFDGINKSLGELQAELVNTTDAVRKMPTPQDVVFPTSFNINKFDELLGKFTDLQTAIATLATQKPVTLPKSFSIEKFDELLEGMEELKKGFNLLLNKEVAEVGFPEGPVDVNIVGGFKYPAPVTHISINSLKGSVLTTALTLTTTSARLPDTALQNRRSLIIYNNSSSVIYIGGADVTTTNGLPVASETFSPPIDAGATMGLYGVVATGTANIRIMEVSDYDMGF